MSKIDKIEELVRILREKRGDAFAIGWLKGVLLQDVEEEVIDADIKWIKEL